MILKPFDGTLGYIVTVVAIMMILSSFVSLCLLNHYRKEETAETVELGLNLIEMILDFFIGQLKEGWEEYSYGRKEK